mgnify:FL=1
MTRFTSGKCKIGEHNWVPLSSGQSYITWDGDTPLQFVTWRCTICHMYFCTYTKIFAEDIEEVSE